MTDKKEKEVRPAAAVKEKPPIEKLIFNNKENKYILIAKCIKESRRIVKNNEDHMNLREIIPAAIEHVYSGK